MSVLHVDHHLRGSESDADAQFVAELSRARGFEFVVERVDVVEESRRNAWNLEDAARRLRYGFFQRVVEQGWATRIAVAHTADDQAETVIAHVVRGTGPTGLGGIHPIAAAIIRPMLGIRRRELREYLEGLGQPWREDSTNTDLRRLRARIRTRLLPQCERDFSPRIVEHLGELARLSREEQVFWSALVEDRFRALVKSKGETLAIRVSDLTNPFLTLGTPTGACQPEMWAGSAPDHQWRALTERLIRRLYQELRGDLRGMTADHVEQVIRLATGSTSGRRTRLPGGILAERTFDELRFSLPRAGDRPRHDRETIPRPAAYQYEVSLPGTGATSVSVPELGIRFSLKLIDWAETQSETKGDCQALDAQSLRAPLILRNWRPGDAYTPCGRRQPRKLKQMLLAARVPAGARREWPVLESAGRLVWARGMPPADLFCASESTRVGVVIEENKL